MLARWEKFKPHKLLQTALERLGAALDARLLLLVGRELPGGVGVVCTGGNLGQPSHGVMVYLVQAARAAVIMQDACKVLAQLQQILTRTKQPSPDLRSGSHPKSATQHSSDDCGTQELVHLDFFRNLACCPTVHAALSASMPRVIAPNLERSIRTSFWLPAAHVASNSFF